MAYASALGPQGLKRQRPNPTVLAILDKKLTSLREALRTSGALESTAAIVAQQGQHVHRLLSHVLQPVPAPNTQTNAEKCGGSTDPYNAISSNDGDQDLRSDTGCTPGAAGGFVEDGQGRSTTDSWKGV